LKINQVLANWLIIKLTTLLID